MTKDAALHMMGVVSKKAHATVDPHTEFVSVAAGRQLLARGAFMRSVLVGVSGSVLVTLNDGAVTQLAAPFVVDRSATDDRGMATVSVMADSDSSLLLVDVRARDAVFGVAPTLRQLAAATANSFAEADELVIELTERETTSTVL